MDGDHALELESQSQLVASLTGDKKWKAKGLYRSGEDQAASWLSCKRVARPRNQSGQAALWLGVSGTA